MKVLLTIDFGNYKEVFDPGCFPDGIGLKFRTIKDKWVEDEEGNITRHIYDIELLPSNYVPSEEEEILHEEYLIQCKDFAKAKKEYGKENQKQNEDEQHEI